MKEIETIQEYFYDYKITRIFGDYISFFTISYLYDLLRVDLYQEFGEINIKL